MNTDNIQSIPTPDAPRLPDRLPSQATPALPLPMSQPGARPALDQQPQAELPPLPDRIPARPPQLGVPESIPILSSRFPSRLPNAAALQRDLPMLPQPRMASGTQPLQGGMGSPVQIGAVQLPDRIPTGQMSLSLPGQSTAQQDARQLPGQRQAAFEVPQLPDRFIAPGASVSLPQPSMAKDADLPQFDRQGPLRNADVLLPDRLPARIPGLPQLPVQSLIGGGSANPPAHGKDAPGGLDQMLAVLERIDRSLAGNSRGQTDRQPSFAPQPFARMPSIEGGWQRQDQSGAAPSINSPILGGFQPVARNYAPYRSSVGD